MAFYYAKEKREFDREWEKLRSEYTTAGMLGEDIEKLYAFDLEWFCSRRRFLSHTQSLPAENIEGDESVEQSSLIRKFSSFSVSLDETLMGGRYGWVEEVEDTHLVNKLRQLSLEDLELLTLIAIDGYAQAEIARIRGCSKNAISKKIIRIKNNLK